MATVEWHPHAFKQFEAIDRTVQLRISRALSELGGIDDVRTKLVPYRSELSGLWELRVGDYRLVMAIQQRNGQSVLIVYLAHRREVYGDRALRQIKNRRPE